MTPAPSANHPNRRRLLTWWIGLLLGAVAAVMLTGTAYAHATVVSSDPAADSIVKSAPTEVTVEFSEPVAPVAAGTTVIAPNGDTANSAPATTKGGTLVYPLKADLPEGTYLVSYRVISADGHPIPGGFTFSIGKTSTPPEATIAATDADPTVEVFVIANRYLGYAGLALALGPGLLLLAGDPGSRRGALRLTAIGLSTVAATSIAGLYLQVPYTAGTAMFGITGGDVGAVLSSRFGGAAMIRMLIVVAVLPLLRRLATVKATKATTGTLAVGAAALALTWPFSGHATTSAAPPLTVLSDTVHVAAMGLWIGGLVTLLLYLVRPSRTTQAWSFLPTWSTWATWLVAALAVAGTAQALIEIGTVPALFTTTYGLLVVAKVCLFALLLASATVARKTVRRSQSSDSEAEPPPVGAVRRMIIVELVVAAMVLGVSAVLVQTVPAQAQQEAVDAEGTESDFYSKKLVTELYTLQFDLEPAGVGPNVVHLYLFDPQDKPLEPVEWFAAFGKSDQEVAPVQYGLSELSPNHVSGDVSIPGPGAWEFTFRIRTSKIDELTVSTVVTVE